MKISNIKKSIVVYSILAVFSFSAVGCGYLLHPNRRGGNHTSTLDPVTILFDVLWLIPGFVPGVVAILVDGMAGTWYYAPGENPDMIVGKNNIRKTPVKLYAGKPVLIKFKTPVKVADKVTVKYIDSKGKAISVRSFKAIKSASVIPTGFMISKNAPKGKARFVLSVNGSDRLSVNTVIR